MPEYSHIEEVASQVIATFGFTSPPIPIEAMLQHPVDGMWDVVDVTQISSGFFRPNDAHSPRMSLARLLVLHILRSEWGETHQLSTLLNSKEKTHAFARMLIMPAVLLSKIPTASLNVEILTKLFEVPAEEARKRLEEWKP